MIAQTQPSSRLLLTLLLCYHSAIATALCLGQQEPSAAIANQPGVSFQPVEKGMDVYVGKELFTSLNTKDYAKPILYPIYAPDQIGMTRNWPMQSGKSEPQDHPHHKSLWIGHFINGVDFWTESGGKVVTKDVQADADSQQLLTKSDWIGAEGSIVCSDETRYVFGVGESFPSAPVRWIDVSVTFFSDNHELRFEDTKEGTFAVRTHPNLQLTPTKESPVVGTARNSEGIQGKEIWGQKAKWVLYQGSIDGIDVALAMFDHPANLRHPTTWHARDYGLVSANPFGLHDLQGKAHGEGQVNLAKGEKLTLRYRALFIKGKPEDETLEAWFKEFSKR